MTTVGVIGAGTMGSGIAQVAATAGHKVVLYDVNNEGLQAAMARLNKIMLRLVEKGKIEESEANDILRRITPANELVEFAECGFVIEAIVENLEVKQKLFADLEGIVEPSATLATNTSSLSVASIAAACKEPGRVVGVHFFNPAPLMPLVEIVPAVQTTTEYLNSTRALIDAWGKKTVLAKDTPGFIVNRVARPFYGEALRIYEEGIADFATIDWAMKHRGGFRMGPFELMDYIGNDINYVVTETVWSAFYYDPRYKPSFAQKRMMEAGYLGKKSGRGYYDYSEGAVAPEPDTDEVLCNAILNRILVMLINEAADALHLGIASRDDIDLAMTKGVNYPKGLLKWADEFGIEWVVTMLDDLYHEYHEERYRCSPLLRRMRNTEQTFY